MKQIKKTVVIIACCAVLSTHTKQVGNKGASPVQPSPTPINYPQPKPAPIINTNQPRPKPSPYYPQPQTGLTYSEIYASLKSKTPDSSDFATLNNIKTEAEKQIKQIQVSVERKPNQDFQAALAQTERAAKELFKKYPINFNKTQQQIDIAHKNDTDIFTKEEQDDMTLALFNIVKEFSNQFSTLSSQQIYDILVAHYQEFKTFQAKLHPEQRKDINDFLKTAVNLAFNIIHKS